MVVTVIVAMVTYGDGGDDMLMVMMVRVIVGTGCYVGHKGHKGHKGGDGDDSIVIIFRGGGGKGKK